MAPEHFARFLREGDGLVVRRDSKNAAAIGSGRSTKRLTKGLRPDDSTTGRVKPVAGAEAGHDENLAIVEGDTAAPAFIGIFTFRH